VDTTSGAATAQGGTGRAPTSRSEADAKPLFSAGRRDAVADAGAQLRHPVAGVGAQLRERRQAAHMSLRQFAKKLGVSASFISQLENGKSQPSVATLYLICSALDVTVDELFAEAGAAGATRQTGAARPQVSPPAAHGVDGALADLNAGTVGSSSPVVSKKGRRRLVLDSGVVWEQLSALRETGVDFMFVRYDVGGSSTLDERLTRHTGIEYGYILSGELEITLQFDSYRVRAGESISFDSTTPHRLHNVGTVPVEAIWFVHGRNINHEH
jgi:transcriptional regulator with XRE-family HTH domain/mannose-6-phosphate isomerase-like protein (cupin superfamily)